MKPLTEEQIKIRKYGEALNKKAMSRFTSEARDKKYFDYMEDMGIPVYFR